MEDFSWHNPLRAVGFGNCAIKLIEVFNENKELKPYCRGFLRDIYKYLINAEVHMYTFDDASKHFEEFKGQMNNHYEYYQEMLSSEGEKSKYYDIQISFMEEYTKDYIAAKQEDITNFILGNWSGEQAEKFAEARGYNK